MCTKKEPVIVMRPCLCSPSSQPTCLMTLLQHGWCPKLLHLLQVSTTGESGPKRNEAMVRALVFKQRSSRKEMAEGEMANALAAK